MACIRGKKWISVHQNIGIRDTHACFVQTIICSESNFLAKSRQRLSKHKSYYQFHSYFVIAKKNHAIQYYENFIIDLFELHFFGSAWISKYWKIIIKSSFANWKRTTEESRRMTKAMCDFCFHSTVVVLPTHAKPLK